MLRSPSIARLPSGAPPSLPPVKSCRSVYVQFPFEGLSLKTFPFPNVPSALVVPYRLPAASIVRPLYGPQLAHPVKVYRTVKVQPPAEGDISHTVPVLTKAPGVVPYRLPAGSMMGPAAGQAPSLPSVEM